MEFFGGQVHEVDFVVVVALKAGGEGDGLSVGVPVGAPVDGVVVGVLLFVFAVDIDDEELEQVVLFSVGAEDDAFAVRGDEGSAVVAGGMGQTEYIRAVGVHGVEFHVAGAVAGEGDLFAGAVEGAFGVVAFFSGEAFEVGAVGVGLEDVHMGVEVPDIFSGADLEALFFFVGVRSAAEGGVEMG